MSRRIEVELTSARPDGTWTWRAAGAREPKGAVDASLLPGGSKVGDVLRVEADIDLDGISILSVLPAKGARKEPERLEIIAERTFDPVTSTLVAKRDRPRRERSDRPPRRDGDAPDRRDRPRGPRRDGPPAAGPGAPADGATRERRPPREPRERRERPPRPPVPMLPERPKPKRLRPGRVHRREAVEALPEEQRPVAEQVLRGGVPAVREAIKEQNEQLKAEGKSAVPAEGVIALAEDLLPRLRVAEWLDRAEAALAEIDELDLRDLRSVVAAAGDPTVARSEETRELSDRLREGLAQRQDREHQEWLADIVAALAIGRVVRALRLSSRPPKAGVLFPPELGSQLAQAASAALSSDAAPDRWGAVLEAVAYSPVRAAVVPAGLPTTVTDELKGMVRPVAGLVPDIATQLGVEPPPAGARAACAPRRPPAAKRPKPVPAPPGYAARTPAADAPAPDPGTAAIESTPVVADVAPEVEAPTAATTGPATAIEAPTAATDEPVEAPPAAEPPVAEEPDADRTATDEPTVEAAVEEPAAEPTVEAAADDAPASPPVEDTAAEPTVDAAAEDPPASPPVEDTAVEDAPASPPVEDAAVEEPAAEPTVDAAVEEPAAEPTVDAAVEEPAAEPTVDAAVEEPAAEPTVDAAADDAPASPPVEDAAAEEPAVESTVDAAVEDPPASPPVEVPSTEG